MKAILKVGLGSGLGGGLRSIIDLLVLINLDLISTFFINVTGSLLIGYLVGLWGKNSAMSDDRGHFWVTGFCGGYTTFSAFSWQVMDLVRQGEGTLAGYYAASSIVFGLAAVWLGLLFAHRSSAQR
jgi:CrcB protein